MRGRIVPFIFLFAAASAPAVAGKMNAHGRCSVISGEKLPAASGGGQAICEAVERAIAAAAPGARYTAKVRVISSTRLAAGLVVNGRALPEQKFAIMDSELNAGSIRRFAQSIATQVAEAAKR